MKKILVLTLLITSFSYSQTNYNSKDYSVSNSDLEQKVIDLSNNSGSLIFKNNSQEDLADLYFKIYFNKAIYPINYYPQLKSFFSDIVDIQNNTVFVLEKNN